MVYYLLYCASLPIERGVPMYLKMYRLILALSFVMLMLLLPVQAQTAFPDSAKKDDGQAKVISSPQNTSYVGQSVAIELITGKRFQGIVSAENDATIQIQTPDGVLITIQRAQIKRITVITQPVGTIYEYTDPNATRLFFSPTARSLKHLQGYFSVYQLFFPSFGLGLYDVVTLNGGISILPGAKQQLYYLASKVRVVHFKQLDLAAGILYTNVTGGEASGAGIAFGVATYGTEDYALTAGLGWGYAEKEFSDRPVLVLGGEARISKNLKILTENWLLPGADTKVLTFGIRFFGRQLAADLGFIYPTGSEMSGFPFIPWVGFAYNFGIRP